MSQGVSTVNNDPWSSKCDQEGCQGHLGKFSSCRDEALYVMSLDGMDEMTGDVEYEGHFTLVVRSEDTRVMLSDDMTPIVTVPAGSYIVQSTEQGFVYSIEYQTEELARRDFQQTDDAYAAWLDDDEDV